MHQDRIAFIKTMVARTKQLAISSIKIFRQLPKNEEARIIGKQFLRAGLSVGADYRAVCRARSKAELFAKLSITVEEADEVLYWLEILMESGILEPAQVDGFVAEANELLSILSTARKNARL